jgi:tryptophan 2,3-dioxygenase
MSAPVLHFPGETPYDQYVRSMQLHDLQHPLTEEPTELPFLVISQIMELYFGLIHSEWTVARTQLRADDLDGAIATLRRCVHHFEGLNASWASLRWMTPMEFNRFRDELGVASGFQSWAYRFVEFGMGLKDPKLITLYAQNPPVYAELQATLHEPSIYQEAVFAMHRRGYSLPDDVLNADMTTTYVPHRAVEDLWVAVYTQEPAHSPAQLLAEVLTDLAEAFSEWRVLHLRAVRRSMGAKTGSGGSSGIAWLENSMARPVFDELWSARTAVGS